MVRLIACAALAVVSLAASESRAALITNMAMPITHRVTVQPIIVSNDDGSNTAEYFGNPTQQALIQGHINTIWAQAGIEVEFLAANTWNNSFANIGNPMNNNPRPNGDLNLTVNAGDAAGVANLDPNILNVYFVEIAAGFSNQSELTANGLGFVGGNGISQHVGDNLVSLTLGRELIAKVVAHEIGHNLNLPHIVEAENLMLEDAPFTNARLNATQMTIALASPFSVEIAAVPEPGSLAVISLSIIGYVARRRKSPVP